MNYRNVLSLNKLCLRLVLLIKVLNLGKYAVIKVYNFFKGTPWYIYSYLYKYKYLKIIDFDRSWSRSPDYKQRILTERLKYRISPFQVQINLCCCSFCNIRHCLNKKKEQWLLHRQKVYFLFVGISGPQLCKTSRQAIQNIFAQMECLWNWWKFIIK